MSAGWTLTIDDAGVTRGLSDLKRAGADLGPLMDRLGGVLADSTRERFSTSTAPDGSPWMPSLRARTSGGKTLVDQGHLRDSVTHVVDGDAVDIGSNLIYAGVHQGGATITAKAGRLSFRLAGGLGFRSAKSVTIPARPFLGLSADDRDEVLDEVGRALADVAGRA